MADSCVVSPREKYAVIAVTTMLANAIGNMTFQPNRINWS